MGSTPTLSTLGNIWHVDDDPSWRGSVTRALTLEGHNVLSTGSFQEAKALIPDGIRDRDLTIVDGNLGDGRGEQIVRFLRESQLPMTIVGMSGGTVEGVDISLDKATFDYETFIQTINGLVEKSGKS